MTLKNVLGDIALDATLRAVRDRLPAALDPLGRLQIALNNPAQDALDAGLIFSSGGFATTGTLNENAHATLTNPTGSGKRLYVQSWAVHATVTAPVRYRIDATSPAPVRPIDSHSVFTGAPASVAEVRCGGGSTTGGYEMAAQHRTGPNAALDKEVPIRLDPGRTLTIHFAAGGLDSTVQFAVAWRERTIPV